MNPTLRRLGSAVSPVALLVALLALVASAAGVGYAAGQIGTSDIKNNAITAKKIKKNAVTTKKIKKNAVTTDKVKDGSLTESDLVAEEAPHVATFSNGGQGDCIWTTGTAVVAGVGTPAYRKDRFGTVHLSGMAVVVDGPGGDADCDPTDPGEGADAIAFTLPAGYVPQKTLVILGSFGGLIIAGPNGATLPPSLNLPPGAVASVVGSGSPVALDNISFEPTGSNVVLPKTTASGRISKQFLESLGAG